VRERALLVLLALLLLPTPAAAEIIDKMPSVQRMWITSSIFVAIIIAVFMWKRWLAFGLWLFLSALHLVGLLDWDHPSFRDAIVRELGEDYLLHAFGAAFLIWSLPLVWLVYKGRGSASASATAKKDN
jgi:hypothetical protein